MGHALPLEADILLIGGGFSGTVLAAQLVRLGSTRRAILVDSSDASDFGPAYRTTNQLHLLNTPAQGMSAFPDQPEHFWKWANQRDGEVGPDSFVPRPLYREYLSSVWEGCAGVTRLQDSAVCLTPDSVGWTCGLASGKVVQAETVVLATGASPTTDLEQLRALKCTPGYVPDLWCRKGADLPEDAKTVGIIGSGLTAVDAVLAFEGKGLAPRFTLISRHGLLPLRHGPRLPGDAVAPEPTASVRVLLRRFREAARAADYRNVIDAMRPKMSDYWRALSPDGREKFVQRLRVYWEAHRHRMPPQVADRVDALRASGRLELHRGRLTGANPVEGGIELLLADGDRLVFDAVINCTGPGSLSCCTSKLLKQLLDDGLVESDSLGFGIKSDLDGRVSGQSGLYTLGILRRGELYESTAVRELSIQAAALASLLA